MSWLLSMALLLVSLPSGASWQCLDGTPCPADCSMMPHARSQSPAACDAPSSNSHCNQCPPVGRVMARGASAADASCTSPMCVLRVSERPASTLQEGVKLFAPLLALPPPPVFVAAPLAPEAGPTAPAPTYLCFLPQRFLRPCLGRAPPVLL